MPREPHGPVVDAEPARRRLLHSTAVRRVVGVVAVLLALSGVGVLARPFLTGVWADHEQDALHGQMDDADLRRAYQTGDVAAGRGLTRLRIPKLDVDVVVAEGTSSKALRAGAGHYAGTPLPGRAGNVGIAGHRVTYGHPFKRLERMTPSDVVTLQTPFAVYTYTVVPPFGGHGNPWTVAPNDYWVVGDQPGGRWLTLTTCHPPGSARQRLVLRLELTGTKYLTSKGEAS